MSVFIVSKLSFDFQEAEEKKKLEALQRKQEAKALLEKETNESTKKANAKAAPAPKVSRAQIQAKVNKTEKEVKEKKIETHLDVVLEENVNRLVVDGEEARTVEEAISVLR